MRCGSYQSLVCIYVAYLSFPHQKSMCRKSKNREAKIKAKMVSKQPENLGGEAKLGKIT